MKHTLQILILLSLATALIVGCGPAANDDQTDNQPTSEPAAIPTTIAESPASTQSAYPGTSATSGYPGGTQSLPPGTLPELPNPERNVPSPTTGTGSIGGYLVQAIGDSGFLPVTAQSLHLGKVLLDNQGQQSVIAVSEDSPSAELLPAGVFVFANVPPGTYGLVINIGYTEFPITVDDQPLILEVEANTAMDLGAVFVEAPE